MFQRLSQDRVYDALPVIMVTARGHPDLATRAFCARLVVGAGAVFRAGTCSMHCTLLPLVLRQGSIVT